MQNYLPKAIDVGERLRKQSSKLLSEKSLIPNSPGIKIQIYNKFITCIYRLFGIICQAYYQKSWEAESLQTADLLILKEVQKIKKNHRVMGTRKRYEQLPPFMTAYGIKIGRDEIFDLLAANQLLIKRRKRRKQTKFSSHWIKKYPNLIKKIRLRLLISYG